MNYFNALSARIKSLVSSNKSVSDYAIAAVLLVLAWFVWTRILRKIVD